MTSLRNWYPVVPSTGHGRNSSPGSRIFSTHTRSTPARAGPVEILARICEPVDVVDRQALDDGRRERARAPCACVISKTPSSPSTRTPPRSLTSKKRRLQAGARVDVENVFRSSGSGPERVLVTRRHVVRHDVEHDPEPCSGGARSWSRARPRAPRRRAPGIDDVVPVCRAGSGLERRREVEVGRCRVRAGTARARGPPGSRARAGGGRWPKNVSCSEIGACKPRDLAC